jgi:hypothetical protein
VGQQPGNAIDQNAGLPAPRAGDDQEGAGVVFHRLALPHVEERKVYLGRSFRLPERTRSSRQRFFRRPRVSPESDTLQLRNNLVVPVARGSLIPEARIQMITPFLARWAG